MRANIIGYIVVSNWVMWYGSKAGRLYFGDSATLFSDRKAARRAIQQTRKQHPTWDADYKPMMIIPIQKEKR